MAVVEVRNEDGTANVRAVLVAVEARRDRGSVSDGIVGLGECVVTVELP